MIDVIVNRRILVESMNEEDSTISLHDDSEESLVQFWSDPAKAGVFHLDVRELLEARGEPYSNIMGSVTRLKNGETLVLHVPFEPKPLIFQLQRMNCTCELKREGVDYFTLSITKKN